MKLKVTAVLVLAISHCCYAAFGDEHKYLELLQKSDNPNIAKRAVAWKQLFDYRAWQSADGKFTTRAKYVSSDAENVTLQKLDGTQITIPLDKLSGASRGAVASMLVAAVEMRSRVIEHLESQVLTLSLANQRQSRELEANEKNISALIARIEELKKFKPGGEVAADDSVPAVSAKEIENAGERYNEKTVKLVGCKFRSVENTWVNLYGLDGKKIIGFFFYDSKGDLFQFAFAEKESNGDLLLSLEDGKKINLVGKVFEAKRDTYVFLAVTIEIAE